MYKKGDFESIKGVKEQIAIISTLFATTCRDDFILNNTLDELRNIMFNWYKM